MSWYPSEASLGLLFRLVLLENRFHSVSGLVSHAGEHVRVCVEGYGDSGVPEKLLHKLGVYALQKQQRGARVP